MHSFARFAFAVAAVSVLLTVSAPAQDPIVVGPDVYKLKLENERVRVLEVTFAPGASIATHSHPDHLAYCIDPGKIAITNADGKEQVLDLVAGQSVWIPAESHSAKNLGTTTIKLVVVEIK
jgi:quercetin dioxygenase-like cupin family protein